MFQNLYFAVQRNKISSDYCVSEDILPEVKSIRDLGVTIQFNSFFSKYVAKIILKCIKNCFNKINQSV